MGKNNPGKAFDLKGIRDDGISAESDNLWLAQTGTGIDMAGATMLGAGRIMGIRRLIDSPTEVPRGEEIIFKKES